PTTIYAAPNAGGVFKSTNGGGSWSAINNGLPGQPFPNIFVFALAIDPVTSTTIYAGMLGGVFVLRQAAPLGEQAAALAKTLLGAPYGYGGKGYDFQKKSYANAPEIFGNYKYYVSDCTSGQTKGLLTAPGVDCSGLVMWSYNIASGATTEFWKNN